MKSVVALVSQSGGAPSASPFGTVTRPGASLASVAAEISSSGGVHLDSAGPLNIDWVTGPSSMVAIFSVSQPTDEQLRGLENPVKLVCAGGFVTAGGGVERYDFDIENLWLSERLGAPDPNDPSVVQWVLEDSRRWGRGLKSVGVANNQRGANDFRDIDGVDAKGNFAQFYRIKKLSLRTPTLKDPAKLAFARYDEAEPVVWTAFELLQFFLGPWWTIYGPRVFLPSGQAFVPTVVYRGDVSKRFADGGLENGHPALDFSLDAPWTVIVSQLLRLAHLDMVPNNRGEWVVFRKDPKDFPRFVGGYTGGGHVVRRDRSRARARTHRTIFSPRYEIRADAYERVSNGAVVRESAAPGQPFPIQTENVVLMPFDVDHLGTTIKRGTWQNIEFALEVWNANATNFYPKAFRDIFAPLTIPKIRKQTLGPQLAAYLSVDPDFAGSRHPRGSAIAKTIYDFYRRAWRIPFDINESLRRIKAQSAQIADPATGKISPARVYLDHTQVLTYYGTFNKKYTAQVGNGFVTQRPWPDFDSQRLLSAADPSDYVEVTVFDADQGVFLLRPLTDVVGAIGDIVFATFKQFPPDALVDRLSADPHFLELCEQHDEWRASWTFTAEPVSASTKSYYVAEKPPTEYPRTLDEASGPAHEERFRALWAGYSWGDGISEAKFGADGQLEFSGFDHSNKDVCDSIATALRDSFYFQADDWIIGTFKALGFQPDLDQAAGGFNVGLTHDAGLFEATYDSFPPQRVPLFEAISPEAAKLLFRLDEGILR